MSFLMPMFLWLIIPFCIFLLKGTHNIIIKTHIIILILLLLSLARPVEKAVLQKANIQTQDIIIAIDISYSMHATDISPSRYTFAKKTIKHLLTANATDTIMLIAFTSNPLLLSPPSTDHALIAIALDNLNPEFILTKGTSLKKLFTTLSSLPRTPKTLILMTDGGEEDEVNPLKNILKMHDISLITLALGTKEGSTIHKKDNSLLKDKEGNLVVTRINPLLKELTQQINGTYLHASFSPKASATDILTALKKHNTLHTIEKKQVYYKELYQVPLLIATVLFLLLYTRAVKYLIILFTFLGLPLHASIMDDYYLHQAYHGYEQGNYQDSANFIQSIDTPSLQSKLLLANTYYKERKYKKAIHIYTSIRSTSLPVKQQLYYNIANAYVHLKTYTKAKTYYIKTLQLGFDADALHNLELCSLLSNKKTVTLGIAHPKSQNAQSSKSEPKDEKKEEQRTEDQSSSSSGSGEKAQSKEKKKSNQLISNDTVQKQPLGSKVYELINKGYIHETHPW
jgi:Ca-activated chloride channel family protein